MVETRDQATNLLYRSRFSKVVSPLHPISIMRLIGTAQDSTQQSLCYEFIYHGTTIFKYLFLYSFKDKDHAQGIILLFIESFHHMCFAGKWLQNGSQADKNESRSLLAVDRQGHQSGGFSITFIDTWENGLTEQSMM